MESILGVYSAFVKHKARARCDNSLAGLRSRCGVGRNYPNANDRVRMEILLSLHSARRARPFRVIV